MREYSFTEARQHFAAILEEASKEGGVCIKKRNGEAFFIKPAVQKKSPLDIEGVSLGIGVSEITDFIREGREREYGY